MVSKYFPKNHKKAGLETNFPQAIQLGEKKTTIRLNYELWKKRFDKISKGEAEISIRKWTGKAYRSKQVELKRLGIDDSIGIQKIVKLKSGFVIDDQFYFSIDVLAFYEALTVSDFIEWFRNASEYVPMALIHFSSLRYSNDLPF